MALQRMSTENGIASLHPTGLRGFDARSAHNGLTATKTLGRQAGLQQPAVDQHRLWISSAQKSRVATAFGCVASIVEGIGEGYFAMLLFPTQLAHNLRSIRLNSLKVKVRVWRPVDRKVQHDAVNSMVHLAWDHEEPHVWWPDSTATTTMLKMEIQRVVRKLTWVWVFQLYLEGS